MNATVPAPKRRAFAGAVLTLLVLASGGCRDTSAGEAAATQEDGPSLAAVLLAAQQGGAMLPPEYADPRLADERTLPMRPLELPAYDFAGAPAETEPNDGLEEATRLAAVPAVRGEVTGTEFDYFAFTSEGEPQLWAVEAVGNGLGELTYHNAAHQATQGAEIEPGRWMIANLFLAPGQHWLAVRGNGSGGGYTLRAVPLGPPDLRMEREPNDDPSAAHALRSGIPRVGLLLDSRDEDHYRFSLRETEHVVLLVTPPPGVVLRVDIAGATLSRVLQFTGREAGEPLRFQALLEMGDYSVTLRSQSGGSRTPYRVRLDRLDPYSLPADIEPNNRMEEASPLPRDHVLRGRVGEFDDADWYRLPVLPQQTAVQVQLLGLSGSMRPQDVLSIVAGDDPGRELVTWNHQDSTLRATLPANTPLFARVHGRGDYQIRLSFQPGLPAPGGPLPLSISVPRGPYLVEAFSDREQRVEVPVTLHNQGTEPLELSLDALASHHAWRPASGSGRITVGAGKRVVVPFQLHVPPDAAPDPVQLAVRASAGGAQTSATTQVFPLCGAAPVNPTASRPLPASLLGGFNVAASAFGGRPLAEGDDAHRQGTLLDGLTSREATIYSSDGGTPELTVALAGDRPLPVMGITLIPGIEFPQEQLKEFELLLSEDGLRYHRVLAGRLSRAPVEQAFALPQPVRARYARLRLLSTQRGTADRGYHLAEWKVIAAPGESPFGGARVNLADPALGGYLVWSYPVAPRRESVLVPEADYSLQLEPTRLNEWVLGFRHNRAAQVDRFEWVQQASTDYRVLSRVDVSVSTESPMGPWTPIGTWNVDTKRGSTSVLDLPAPVWARFVRFSSNEPERADEWWRLPQTIRVFERAQDDRYRSILSEWGHYAKPAIYEQLAAATAHDAGEEVTGNGGKERAHTLRSGVAARGRVLVEEDEDWYRIVVPSGHNRLSIDVQGDPMLRVAAVLLDQNGRRVPTEVEVERGRALRLEAPVEAGRTYYLHVTEPPRSIALVWDNSGSVEQYRTTLYRALWRFTERVQPRREFVNLLPFHDREPRFLVADWTDQPFLLQGALQNYDRTDGSSNAEVSLRSATEALRDRPGNTAIVFLTDADSGGYPETAELWKALGEVRPRVFAVELHGGEDAGSQQQLMQSWADASNGHYSLFRTSEDVDVAFERASCFLRRPARFVVTATTSELYDALVAHGRVALQGILFDTGSDRIRPESEPTLREITGMLRKHPDLRMLVEGHTDNVGRMAANQVLSEKRAAAVRAYLVAQGIAGTRLQSKGYGDTMPAAPNDTPGGRQQNRRVELVRL